MEYDKILHTLQTYGQEHLLKYYDSLQQKDQECLLKQIADIDWGILKLLQSGKAAEEKGLRSGIIESIAASYRASIESEKK